jgi:hypothetical protein
VRVGEGKGVRGWVGTGKCLGEHGGEHSEVRREPG